MALKPVFRAESKFSWRTLCHKPCET